jgi:nucleoside-diphosphate-sugar epimerase
VDPRTDYAVAKAAATLLSLADSQRGRPVAVVRLFAVYGPGEAPYRLVPYVMDCCLGGVAPRVAAGQQWRDFIHVDDVVALLRRTADLVPSPGLVLHAASGRAHRVREMVEAVLAVAGNPVRAVYTSDSGRADDPAPYLASVAQTHSLTGWEPRHGLQAGVELTWAWHRTQASRRAA